MDNQPFHQPEEVVLTYRQHTDISPIQLRYERELPLRMQEPEKPEFDPPAYDEAAALAAKKRRRRRVIAGILILAALIALGVALAFSHGAGGGEYRDPNGIKPGAGNGVEEDPEFYWDVDTSTTAETTMDTYRPMGGSVPTFALTAVEEGTEPFTPGQIYETISPSTVTVLGYVDGAFNIGTGIIFHSDGYILTNYHIIAGSSSCDVWVTDAYGIDTEYSALLVGGDSRQDIAVLKIDATDLTAAQFGVSDDLAVGDKVYAIGNPLGVELRGTFTDGIVSAINRDVEIGGEMLTLIQTNAALNSGNSGGPLINQYGQVVGINVAKMMSGYDSTIEGLGFAIPTSLALRWVNDIIRTGQLSPQPVLGLSANRIPDVLPDGNRGLLIVEIIPGLSADKAGLQLGDYLISFAGEDVESIDEVLYLRRSLYVGDKVPVRIYRDGEYLDLVMTMMAEAE